MGRVGSVLLAHRTVFLFCHEIRLGTAWDPGRGFEQPVLVRGVPVHGREAGTG